MSVRISKTPIDPDAEGASFRRQFERSGGIVLFIGQVRGDSASIRLSLEHYPGHTERCIERFAAEARARWPLDGLRIVHRVGEMAPGEAIVFVAAAAAHRRDAFAAVDFLMDYLKSEAPFWKREFDGGAWRWVEPRAEDYADIARWNGTDKHAGP
jgi:molybdopterin synthase catalytic subunit